MFQDILARLDAIAEVLEAAEASSDAEALLRVQLAELLAGARRIAAALAADEAERQ